mmetsp:Transcript_34256/g.102366  ORF Transcript_34256/g.102366 Transcript_34256/m.102366 type:complete len:512 (+) Transcript_34256:207-1742(+)
MACEASLPFRSCQLLWGSLGCIPLIIRLEPRGQLTLEDPLCCRCSLLGGPKNGVQQSRHELLESGPVLVEVLICGVNVHPDLACLKEGGGMHDHADLPGNLLLPTGAHQMLPHGVPRRVRNAHGQRRVDVLVHQVALHEDLKQVACQPTLAALASERTDVQPVLLGQVNDLSGEFLGLCGTYSAVRQQALDDSQGQRAHGVSMQEDRRGRCLGVDRKQRRCGADADGLETRVVVLIRPRGELGHHRRGVRYLREAAPHEARQGRIGRLEAKQHSCDSRLDLVDQRRVVVRVVERCPLTAVPLLVLQHLLEAVLRMLVLVYDGAKIHLLPPSLALRAEARLLLDRLNVQRGRVLDLAVATPGRRLRRSLWLRCSLRLRRFRLRVGLHLRLLLRLLCLQAARKVQVPRALCLLEGGRRTGRSIACTADLPHLARGGVPLRPDVEVELVEGAHAEGQRLRGGLAALADCGAQALQQAAVGVCVGFPGSSRSLPLPAYARLGLLALRHGCWRLRA